MCPSCQKLTLRLISSRTTVEIGGSTLPQAIELSALIRPKSSGRPPIPPEVPPEFSEDYLEACLVLADSPKASGALSRRCLQHILRKGLSAPTSSLHGEIQWAIKHGNLPSSIVNLLDVPCRVGQNAAHPNEDTATGEIVDVEPWEAEWCLEVIEALYDHIFVVPARNRERLARLNQPQAAKNT